MLNTIRRRALTRAASCFVAPVVMALLTGCGATAPVAHYETRPNDPMAIASLRVIFVETQFKLSGEKPWLSSEQVNQQRAMMSEAFQTEFPKAMAAAGVKAEVKSFASPLNTSDPAVRSWFGRWPDQSHVLVVEPSGGRIFCTGGPCNFRFKVSLETFSTNGMTLLWAADLTQPDMTPSMKPGQRSDYEHFSREIARVLLQDTTAKPVR